MKDNATDTDWTWWVDALHEYSQLAPLLPPAKDEARYLRCRHCEQSLGCLSNSRALVIGTFERNFGERGRLSAASVINQRRVALKCGSCGETTIWCRTNMR